MKGPFFVLYILSVPVPAGAKMPIILSQGCSALILFNTLIMFLWMESSPEKSAQKRKTPTRKQKNKNSKVSGVSQIHGVTFEGDFHKF